MSNKVFLKPLEVRELVCNVLDINKRLTDNGTKKSLSLNIEGKPGIGKTALLVEICNQRGMGNVKLNLANIEEVSDLVGYPLIKYQVEKQRPITYNDKGIATTLMFGTEVTEDGSFKKYKVGKDKIKERVDAGWSVAYETQKTWVDDKLLPKYGEMGWELSVGVESKMTYAPPAWLNELDSEEGNVLILDDYTRATPQILQACMTIVNEQSYYSWDLPPNTTVLLTTNPDDGESMVNAQDEAMETRTGNISMKFDPKDWAIWAEGAGIEGRCINFVLLQPDVMSGSEVLDTDGNVTQKGKTVNARQMTNFFYGVGTIPNWSDPANFSKISKFGQAYIGEAVSFFLSFINNKLDMLMSPEDMLDLKIDENDILRSLSASIKGKVTDQAAGYRADISSALGFRLQNYIIVKYKNSKFTKADSERVLFLLNSKYFGVDVVTGILRNLVKDNKFGILIDNQQVRDYLTASYK